MKAYEVKDADGSTLALYYVDYFARESKRGGAWMNTFREQCKEDGEDVRPIIVNVCNFSKPSAGQPALLSLDEAKTLFHEFGHALHGMLANGTYASLVGPTWPGISSSSVTDDGELGARAGGAADLRPALRNG